MLTIIAKGKVGEYPSAAGSGYLLIYKDDLYSLGSWAKTYVGKTIVISLEEEEPILGPWPEELLVPA